MKKIYIPLILFSAIFLFVLSCKKEEPVSEKVRLLTQHLWTSDKLLADGQEAGGPGELLEGFKGDAKFNEDGTGYVGIFNGSWALVDDETKLSIISDSLSIVTDLVNLTETSLIIHTVYPTDSLIIDIRMEYIPK
jgi:hypothetical protein